MRLCFNQKRIKSKEYPNPTKDVTNTLMVMNNDSLHESPCKHRATFLYKFVLSVNLATINQETEIKISKRSQSFEMKYVVVTFNE